MTYRLKFANPDLPIVDHENDGFLVQVIDADCNEGVRDDPANCALALASRRGFRRLKSVHILATVAYFEFPDRIERLMVSAPTSGMIRTFDRTDRFVPGLYRFNAVPATQTRAAKKLRNETKGRNYNGTRPNAGNRAERTAIIRPRGAELDER